MSDLRRFFFNGINPRTLGFDKKKEIQMYLFCFVVELHHPLQKTTLSVLTHSHKMCTFDCIKQRSMKTYQHCEPSFQCKSCPDSLLENPGSMLCLKRKTPAKKHTQFSGWSPHFCPIPKHSDKPPSLSGCDTPGFCASSFSLCSATLIVNFYPPKYVFVANGKWYGMLATLTPTHITPWIPIVHHYFCQRRLSAALCWLALPQAYAPFFTQLFHFTQTV